MTEPSPWKNVKSLALVLALVASGPALASPADEFFRSPSFWNGKPKLQTKLRDERAVLVSVKTESAEPNDRFSIQGVGWVRREKKAVFELAKDFERLKDISDHFRKIKHEPATGKVFVICQALGYQARMLFRVEAVETEGADSMLKFEVIDGHFLGLRGELRFRDVDENERGSGVSKVSEVALRVFHEASEIPIPRILVGFALEILVQRVAVKMRTYFETAVIPGGATPATGAP